MKEILKIGKNRLAIGTYKDMETYSTYNLVCSYMNLYNEIHIPEEVRGLFRYDGSTTCAINFNELNKELDETKLKQYTYIMDKTLKMIEKSLCGLFYLNDVLICGIEEESYMIVVLFYCKMSLIMGDTLKEVLEDFKDKTGIKVSFSENIQKFMEWYIFEHLNKQKGRM